MDNAEVKSVLHDMREYFLDCAKNAQPNSAAHRRFLIYDKAISEAFEAISARPERGDHFYVLLICAMRYCLGRRTYMVELVTQWIMSQVKELPAETARIMLQDIEEQRETGRRLGREMLGDSCDVRVWDRFESWLKERTGDA